jgi:hypothetical protein
MAKSGAKSDALNSEKGLHDLSGNKKTLGNQRFHRASMENRGLEKHIFPCDF